MNKNVLKPVRVCVCACVRARVHVCVCVREKKKCFCMLVTQRVDVVQKIKTRQKSY
jgi:hypothetical protein